MNVELDPALELFPDPLVIVGVDGTVRAANSLAARLVGRRVDELTGARASEILPSYMRPSAYVLLENMPLNMPKARMAMM